MKTMSLILHQLFHDGFEALFKLAAVLGAGHDDERSSQARAVARKLGTSPSAMRWARPSTIAVLPHAGFADQHRVVLGAAAEDLNDALEFAVAATSGSSWPSIAAWVRSR